MERVGPIPPSHVPPMSIVLLKVVVNDAYINRVKVLMLFLEIVYAWPFDLYVCANATHVIYNYDPISRT